MARGTLFLVVGPSGAGKDTLIRAARSALDDGSGFVFARRVITRPAGAGGEDHEAVSAAEFTRRAQAGAFMLRWRAYETEYGIPSAYAGALAAGSAVVANVSRTVIADAAVRFAPVRAVEITAPREVLESRLVARSREGIDGVAARLARSAAIPDGVPLSRLHNAGSLDDGAARLLEILLG